MRACSTAASISPDLAEIWRAVVSGKGAMPPAWWQPAHLSRMIGATSFVKLGDALPPREAAMAASGTARTTMPATTRTARVALRMLGVICTPEGTKLAADLPHGAARSERLA